MRIKPDQPLKGEDPGVITDADMEDLLPLLGEERITRMREALDHRTRSVTVVMEGFSDPHNSSAVMRTCEAFGIQDAHVVKGPHSGKHRRPNKKITRGSTRWTTIKRWDSTPEALLHLQQQGYRICVAHLGGSRRLTELDFTERTALWLGNEHEGPSAELLRNADETFEIPMVGFVESFNVSVAAALCLQEAYNQRERKGGHGDLSSEEKEYLFRQWVVKDVRHGPSVLEELRKRRNGEVPTP